MFGTRSFKIWGDIRSRKGRTFMVAASIFFGVLGVVTLQGMGDLLIGQLSKDIQEDRLAMQQIALAPKPGQASTEDTQLFNTLDQQPEVVTVEGVVQATFHFKTKEAGDFEQGTLQASSSAMDQVQLEPWQLVSGNYPVLGQQQIAVDRRMAEHYGLDIGDSLILRMVTQGQGGAPSAVTEEYWTISGILFQPYQGFNLKADQLAFATLPDARMITGISGFTNLKIRYTSFELAEANDANLVSAIEHETHYSPIQSQTLDPAQNQQVDMAQIATQTLNLLGMTALIVSGFLVFNVVNVIIVEQKRQIGVLKSLGASRKDVIFIYSGIAFWYGVMGVIPGVLLGIPLSNMMAHGIAPMLNTEINDFHLSTSAILTGTLIGLAIPVLASLIPVYNGTRVTILEAMTDLGITSQFGSSRLERWIAQLPVSIEIRQGASNVLQKRNRVALTTFTLAIAAGAFMGVFASSTNLAQTLNKLSDDYNASILILPNDPQDFATLQAIVETVDGVKLVQPADFLQVEIEGYETPESSRSRSGLNSFIRARGYDLAAAEPTYNIDLTAGTLWEQNDPAGGIVISSGLAVNADKVVGDSIVLLGAGKRQAYTIIGIADDPLVQVWLPWQSLAELSGSVLDGNPIPRGATVILDQPNPTPDETDKSIGDINEALIQHGINATYQNYPEFVEQTTQAIGSFQIMTSSATMLIALVGALGLLSTLYMSVFERQKEIGIMRSIGARSTGVALQFISEGVMVGFVAWLVGLPISYMVSSALEQAIQLGEAFQFSYPISAALLGAVGMLVVTLVSSLLPSLSAAHKTVSDILRYQ